jgi:hypothetical protein
MVSGRNRAAVAASDLMPSLLPSRHRLHRFAKQGLPKLRRFQDFPLPQGVAGDWKRRQRVPSCNGETA